MLRSIQKSYELIRSEDPDTAITTHTIRNWCKDGKVFCLNAGTKILVDIDSLKSLIDHKG